eukprot:m.170615 g.170615  ORF g.170615 m.170615 type:complete len:678 (-) comp14798_c0_seq1:5135-7168(-)
MSRLPWTIDEIREQNPALDDEQAHRAHLLPSPAVADPGDPEVGLGHDQLQWDSLVDSLTQRNWKPPRGGVGGAAVPRLHRKSRTKLNRRRVQLYTTDFSRDTFIKAATAGFFLFGSEFELEGADLEMRSLLNLELCDEPTATAGRVILDGVGGLTLGKRALKGLLPRAVDSARLLDGTPSLDAGGPSEGSLRSAGAPPEVGFEGGSGVGSVKKPHANHGKSVRADTRETPLPPSSTRAKSGGSKAGDGWEYTLTVGRRFDEVVARCVAQHGVDWVGFTLIRDTMSTLASTPPESLGDAFRMVSIELWAHRAASTSTATPDLASAASTPTGTAWRTAGPGGSGSAAHRAAALGASLRETPMEVTTAERAEDGVDGDLAGGDLAGRVLVSGEIGYIVGSCYTCLTLFADEARFPRSSRLRVQAGHLWLARAGVTLFDAGTTAAYFESLHGYKRATRREFVSLWRAHRKVPLAAPGVLAEECTDLHGLLQGHLLAQSTLTVHTTHGRRADDVTEAAAAASVPPAAASHVRGGAEGALQRHRKRKRGANGDAEADGEQEGSGAGAADQGARPGSTSMGGQGKPHGDAKGVGVRVVWKHDDGATVSATHLTACYSECGALQKVVGLKGGSAVVVFATPEAAARAVALAPAVLLQGGEGHPVVHAKAELLTTRKKRRKDTSQP